MCLKHGGGARISGFGKGVKSRIANLLFISVLVGFATVVGL